MLKSISTGFVVGLVWLVFLGGCAIAPPVLEMALADASMRQAREIGVENKQPSMYAKAQEAYQKADHYFRNNQANQARYYAIQARQIIEKAELNVVEETGLVSEESEVVTIGVPEEDKKSANK